MSRLIRILILTLLIQACNTEITSFKKLEKVVLKTDGVEEFFYWEFQAEDFLWQKETGIANGIDLYCDTLNLILGEKRYQSAVERESVQNLDTALIRAEEDGDRINALLVHTGTIGRVREINFLEAQILNYQIEKYPLFSKPTEFHGFILNNEANRKLRVYIASSDTEWPPQPSVILNELDVELKKGWKLKFHLHNHYCKEDMDYVGILAPSLADAQYYKMLKEQFQLETALITNGFHTVEIDSQDFEKFESH
ncbi:MAG: hypothetical protein HKN92_01535 [Chitinophagales bacterium]|nr:hypothetical protein [Chitinophagales bacterium]